MFKVNSKCDLMTFSSGEENFLSNCNIREMRKRNTLTISRGRKNGKVFLVGAEMHEVTTSLSVLVEVGGGRYNKLTITRAFKERLPGGKTFTQNIIECFRTAYKAVHDDGVATNYRHE